MSWSGLNGWIKAIGVDIGPSSSNKKRFTKNSGVLISNEQQTSRKIEFHDHRFDTTLYITVTATGNYTQEELIEIMGRSSFNID